MNTTIDTAQNVNIYNNKSISSKVCTKCNQIKFVTEYNKYRQNSNKLRSCCKSCESITNKLYRDNNKQINAYKIYNENDVKTCSKCNQNKPLIEYQKIKQNQMD